MIGCYRSQSMTTEAGTAAALPEKRWYILRARSGMENRVKEKLQEHVVRYDMQDYFGRILVPTEKVVEMRGGQKRTTERKFFPGYLLVHMHLSEHTWHLVKQVPFVSGFIGGSDVEVDGKKDLPPHISDAEAEKIIEQMSDGDQPRMRLTYAPGELVRIIDGPFEDFHGKVEEANYEKDKLRVLVSVFGQRLTPLELNFSQVEKS